jgi:hypothetical protein
MRWLHRVFDYTGICNCADMFTITYGFTHSRYQQRFGGEFLVPESYPPVLNDRLKEKIKQEQIDRKSMFER